MLKSKKIKRNVRHQEKRPLISFAKVIKGVKKFFVASFVLALLGGAGYSLASIVGNVIQKPIAHITVNGDLKFVKNEAIYLLMEDAIKKSFVGENLQGMRKKVLENPWVDNVFLQRQWPDTLIVDVVEQQPIARWGDKGFVNFRGELVLTEENQRLNHLPVLNGSDHETALIMKQYQILSQFLTQHEKNISQLEKDALGIWRLHLNNGWELVIGRSDLSEKIQRFLKILSTKNIPEQESIQVVDMRYENGIAVKWHAEAEQALTQVEQTQVEQEKESFN
jgi:cell division protein FtsQ